MVGPRRVDLAPGESLKTAPVGAALDPASDVAGLFFLERGVVQVSRATTTKALPSTTAVASDRGALLGDLNARAAAVSTVGPGWVLGAEDVARRTAALGTCAARTHAVLHFLSLRAISDLERTDPAAAIAAYKVVASVNTSIANRCKLALARLSDVAFDG